MQPAPDPNRPPADPSAEPTVPLASNEQGVAGGKGLLPIQPTVPADPPPLPPLPMKPDQVIRGTANQSVLETQESTEIETTYISEVEAPQTPIGRRRRTNKTIRYLFTVIEILLVLRFFLKIAGANPSSPFGLLLYGLTDPVMAPFESLLPTPHLGGSQIEFTTLLALVVYPVFGWMIARASQLIFYHEQAGQRVVHQKRRIDREGF